MGEITAYWYAEGNDSKWWETIDEAEERWKNCLERCYLIGEKGRMLYTYEDVDLW